MLCRLGAFGSSTKPHIIVCGKAVRKDSGVLVSFLAECLHPDKDIVRLLLVSETMDEKLLSNIKGVSLWSSC